MFEALIRSVGLMGSLSNESFSYIIHVLHFIFWNSPIRHARDIARPVKSSLLEDNIDALSSNALRTSS